MRPRFLAMHSRWDDAVRIATRWTRPAERDWIFRGQRDESWRLETSLERALNEFGCHDQPLRREAWMLRQFQRRAHHHLVNPPQKRLEWLALMQHHGAPSRLLDFTYSFYVASVFALEPSGRDPAIWALNIGLLRERSRAALGVKGSSTYSYLLKCSELAEAMLGLPCWSPPCDMPPRTIICAEPTRLNERISAQQGLFVLPTDLTCSLEQNLMAAFGYSGNDRTIEAALEPIQGEAEIDPRSTALVKIIISKEELNAAICDLNEMNIHHGTLFPGMDGFARSLKRSLSQRGANENWNGDDDLNLQGGCLESALGSGK